MEILTGAGLTALLEIIIINIVLSGDNAIVIGLAAAGLPVEQRQRAILIGIIAATGMRIVFALIATQLLEVQGLVLAGGLLLLWVCWKMYTELRSHQADADAHSGGTGSMVPEKTLRTAVMQIVVADVSMSIDNVLAIAGIARDHIGLMVVGLIISIVLMAVASSFIAKMIERYRWIGYVGLAILIYVALKMVYEGGHELMAAGVI